MQRLRSSTGRCITFFFRDTSDDASVLLEWIEKLGGAAFCREYRFDTTLGGEVIIGSTLLHRAVMNKSNLQARVLIDVGVPIDSKDPAGCTALHYLCGYHAEKTQPKDGDEMRIAMNAKLHMLIDAGANIDLKVDSCKTTPLMAAAFGLWAGFQCFKPMMEELITLGADCTTQSKYGQTMIHLTAVTDHVQLMHQLLDTGRLDINCKCIDGSTALFHATPVTLPLLLQRGANMSIKDKDGNDAVSSMTRGSIHYDQLVVIWDTEVVCR